MGFDPIASSHFHVIEHIEEEQDDECMDVDIYSSKTTAWIYKESKWDEHTDMTFYRQPSVFLNGCLHIMGHSREYSMILAIDMEGNTWRRIDRPSGLQYSMHQSQGHLCICTVASPNDSKLSICILKDYGTNNWILKHTVNT